MNLHFRRPLWSLFGLLLMAQFRGEVVQAAPLQTTSVSITMSNPSCVQARPPSGACAIQIGYVVASGSDPSFSRLEVLVDGNLRAYMSGFFESTAYLTRQMMPGGLSVACERSNASGSPNYGNA